MQQIKLFIGREDHTAELESDVNSWIASSGVKVLAITSNLAPQTIKPDKIGAPASSAGSMSGRRFEQSDILVMVTYEKA